MCHVLVISGSDTLMSDCVDGDVRLVGGDTEYEGRVEVCINRAWGTICSRKNNHYWSWWSSWESPDSNVVCRQLGHMGLGMYSELRNSCLRKS